MLAQAIEALINGPDVNLFCRDTGSKQGWPIFFFFFFYVSLLRDWSKSTGGGGGGGPEHFEMWWSDPPLSIGAKRSDPPLNEG